jgi:exopolysaccharide production protein ExoQ
VTSFLRSPSLPVAVLLAVGPAAAVAQFRAMAPAVTVAFLLAILAHWRLRRRLPVPRLAPLPMLALLLLGWAALSSLWSIEPARAIETVLSLAALLVLAAGAGRALEMDEPENLARLGLALALGLVLCIALLAFDHAAGNLFRRAVRGFPPWVPQLGFGLKPPVSLLALLLPLVFAVPRLPLAAKLAVALPGLAVALWLPGESAKIAAALGLLATAVAALAPRLVARASAALVALVFLAAPLVFGIALARLPDLSPLPYSASHRVLIWDFAAAQIAERPVLGWGMEASRGIPGGTTNFDTATLGRFGLTSPEERGFFTARQTQRLPLHPHNAALQVWLELGLVGAVLAAALAAAAFLAASPSAAALGAAVAGAVTGQLSFGVWQPWWIASLLLAAVITQGLRPRIPPGRSAP